MQTPKFLIFAPQMPPLAKYHPGRPPSLALLPAATDYDASEGAPAWSLELCD